MAQKDELAQSYKLIGEFITAEGDLDSGSKDWNEKKNPNWIQWIKDNDTITLDGHFTVEELKEILTFVTGGCISSHCPFFFKEKS